MEKYIQMAMDMKMLDAVPISPDRIRFDLRALFKCRWGCEDYRSSRCGVRDTTMSERMEMVRLYQRILLVHSHDVRALGRTVLAIERQAFLDGSYFALALMSCNLCGECQVKKGEACLTPDKVRPCEAGFGIDIYATVRGVGLPIQVLPNKEEVPNRYGFILID
ncbi:MAG: DUF2284 domain-containing protein [Deltaproteobacteria bacterium]|nr:DUF2284 domain-containing protein [Deltaproteobacteria bacterium]